VTKSLLLLLLLQFTAIIQVSVLTSTPNPPVKNWRVLLGQSFTAFLPLLMAASEFGLERWR